MAGPIGVGVHLSGEVASVASRPETALEEALRLVHGDRGQSYGHPLEDFTAVAAAMNAYLSKKYKIDSNILEAADVPVFQILVKVMREAERPKRDNRVDIAGYAETLQMVHDRLGIVTSKSVP